MQAALRSCIQQAILNQHHLQGETKGWGGRLPFHSALVSHQA